MINLAIGIAIGAAFSKFWIAAWNAGVAKVKDLIGKKE